MRQTMRLKIKLPKEIDGSPIAEAEYYASLYKKARSRKKRLDIVESLLANGSNWDVISRSSSYYRIFEQYLNKHFPLLWGQGNINNRKTWLETLPLDTQDLWK